MSLRNKTLSGMFWSFLEKIGSRGVTFVVMIILARLLTPKDFGLIGMLVIFIQLSQALIDGGFNLALIQKKEVDNEDYSAVFYLNTIVSTTLYLIVFFCAPFISEFYDQHSLTDLVRILALVFVFNSFSYVQEARLIKAIRFKTLTFIGLPSVLIGGIISILMAFRGYGVWSIIAFQLVSRGVYAIQIWFYSKWRPRFSFNITKAKKLFSFGSKLLVSRIITTIYDNISLIVIGKFFPVNSVGYYQNAYNLATVPSNTITSVLSGVSFPVFSTIQDDDLRLKSGYKRLMQQAFYWICPAYVISGVLSSELFTVIFTEKWLPAVPYFQLLCVVAILRPLSTYNLNIVNVKGRSDIFLRLQIVRRVVTIAGIVAVIPYGITALLVVQAASSVFTYILFSFYSGKFIDYRFNEQFMDIFPILLLSIAMGVVVLYVNSFLAYFSNILRILIGYTLGFGGYYFFSRYFNFPAYLDLRQVFEERILKKTVQRK